MNSNHQEDEDLLRAIETCTSRQDATAAVIAKRKRAERVALTFLASMMILLFATLGVAFTWIAKENRESKRAAYEVWIKETGNEQNLSYEEWKVLYLESGYHRR